MRIYFALFISIIILLISSFQTSKIIHTIQYTHDTADFNNEYVVVYKNKSLLHNSDNNTISKKILVALSDVSTVCNKKEILLRRGSVAVFNQKDLYTVPVGLFFEIGIKKDHPVPEKPVTWHEPTLNTIVYDDQDFRIFEERLAPHQERSLHSHMQRLVVRLNTVHLTDPRYYPNGQEGKGIQESNTIKFAEPMEHVVKNLSDTALFNIVIEFKHKQ